jgi:hypothetical protein
VATKTSITSEQLHPDLSQYIVGKGVREIRHPLLQILVYSPELNGVYNQTYLQRKSDLAKAKDEKNWRKYIFLHERPFRLDAFNSIQKQLTDAEYWAHLGNIWADSENLYQYGDLIPKLMLSERPEKERIMRYSERQLLARLPEEVVVYRGYQKNKKGWSWTLSQWKARWFGTGENPQKQNVVRAKVKKEHIIAVITRRNQFECIIDPQNLKGARSFDPKDWVDEKMIALAMRNATTQLEGSLSHHGLWHWMKVDWNVIQLCKKAKSADLAVCRAFAYLHDCRRVNEVDDPEHGNRAAAYAQELFDNGELSLTGEQLAKLKEAIVGHELGGVTHDVTIGTCWDADRLDLLRVGIIPNPKLLSTETAKDFIWRI